MTPAPGSRSTKAAATRCGPAHVSTEPEPLTTASTISAVEANGRLLRPHHEAAEAACRRRSSQVRLDEARPRHTTGALKSSEAIMHGLL